MIDFLLHFAATSWMLAVAEFWRPTVAATAWPAWAIMWVVAFSIYAGLKLATLAGWSARNDWRRASE